MYVCGFQCVGFCVCSWVGGQKVILSSTFLTGVRVSKIGARKILRERLKWTKDVGQFGVRLRSRESNFRAEDARLVC